MKKVRTGMVATFLCLLIGLGFSPSKAFSNETELPTQKIKPGDLSGIISDSTGKRLPGKKILITDPEGNVIGTATSNKYGMYRIKDLPEGNFILRVDDKAAAKLTVSRGSTVSTLMIVMPVKPTGLTPKQWTLIGAGGAAVVIGVPVIIHNSKDSSRHRVSP